MVAVADTLLLLLLNHHPRKSQWALVVVDSPVEHPFRSFQLVLVGVRTRIDRLLAVVVVVGNFVHRTEGTRSGCWVDNNLRHCSQTDRSDSEPNRRLTGSPMRMKRTSLGQALSGRDRNFAVEGVQRKAVYCSLRCLLLRIHHWAVVAEVGSSRLMSLVALIHNPCTD